MLPSKLLLVGPATFRSFRCLWMLEELQVPFDRSMARPQSEESKQYHPLGKIPALVVNNGEFCIYESASINSYLGDAYKSNLVPQHASISAGGSDYQTFVQRRAKYDQTVTFIMSEMDAQGLWIQRKHETLAKLFGKSPEAVQEAKRQFENANRVLYDQLNPYLLGEHFSAADILYAHCLEWATDIGWDGGDAFMNGDAKLQHYLEQCQSRPAYVRAAARRKEEEQAKAKYLKEKAAKKKHDLRSKI